MAKRAIRIHPGTSLKEASRIMVVNGAQEALVDGKSPGVVNLVDITRAVAEGRTDLQVQDIMTPGYLTIRSDAPPRGGKDAGPDRQQAARCAG